MMLWLLGCVLLTREDYTKRFDGDGDGYNAADLGGDDCDDDDAAISPGADERCDGVDNNCDGEEDESTATDADLFWPDLDRDTYGDPGGEVAACELPPGHVPRQPGLEDCDDGDDDVHPGADEVCDDIDNNCDGDTDESTALDATTWYPDEDEDDFGDGDVPTPACDAPSGYTTEHTDCDDADPSSWPGAPEACDGVDHDCDGATLEPDSVDAATWELDGDGDTYGDPTTTTTACTEPSGYVATGGTPDCDDGDGAVNPAAAEVCNGVDDDCDGGTDLDADDALPWYADADEDTYGDSAAPAWACTAPDGYVADDTDCDDLHAAAHPGGAEVCDADDLDEDCDGLADDDDPGATGQTAWYTDGDGDGWGDTSAADACDAPATSSAASGDCDDADDAVHPEAEEVCDDGVDNNCDGTHTCGIVGTLSVADADVAVSPGAGSDDLGRALASGDLDLDGVPDLLAGDPGDDEAGTDAGVVYLLDGPLVADLAADSGVAYRPRDAESALGTALAHLGDVDADGIPDVAFGQPISRTDTGGVLVLLGPVTGPGAPDGLWDGLEEGDRAGASLAGEGDVDGDGDTDLVVGQPGADPGGFDAAGIVSVLYGPATGQGDLGSAEVTLVGDEASWNLGYAVGPAGDSDADGLAEVWIGAPGATDATYGPGGAAFLVTAATTYDGSVRGSAIGSVAGTTDGALLGAALDGHADLTGDGYADLLVGAPGARSAWLVTGPLPPDPVPTNDAAASFTLPSGAVGFGAALAVTGDHDGDGELDVAIADPAYVTTDGTVGAVFVYAGPFSGAHTTPVATLVGDTDSGSFGAALVGVGDQDGDGYDELAVGAPDAGDGWIYLWLGGEM